MLQRFKQFIDGQHLFSAEQEVLLAVSGGRDSVVLTQLMRQAGFRFGIAHCNFHLRGEESDRDQRFVADMAAKLEVPFHTVDFDTRDYAQRHGQSIEEAARHLRYTWFAEILGRHGYACLATAHHLDDSVETFFLNLMRGTGIAGLHGIRPITVLDGLKVVRPMLCFSRAEIDEYLAQTGLGYVDDSTNSELEARRNQLRHLVMPQLQQLYPAFLPTMQSNMERIFEVEQLYRMQIESLRTNLLQPLPSVVPGVENRYMGIDLRRLDALPSAHTVLYELLHPFGFTADALDDMLQSRSHTGALFVSRTHEATQHRGMIVVGPRVPKAAAPSFSITSMQIEHPMVDGLRLSQHEIMVDADTVRQPLHVRPWMRGDRFAPFGSDRTRLVSDFLKDQKLHRLEKRAVHLLVDADDRPLWVMGLRADNRFRLTQSTRSVMRITLD